VSYLECAKKGRGRRSWGQSWVKGQREEAEDFFVHECLNFDVVEEKISKTAKNVTIEILVG